MQHILAFLSELAANNNREWFAANRSLYQSARERFTAFSADLIHRLSTEVDPSLAGLTPADCIWRIFRDVRFSHDKRPYKDWFGVFPAAAHRSNPRLKGKKSLYGGYYVHLQPGHCLFAGGIWCPPPDLLRALRNEIRANYDEVEAIMASPQWQRYFGDFDTDDMLKRVPAGYDADFVHADWLKRKSFTFSTPLTDAEVCAPDFLDHVVALARIAKPMNDFLNYTFEEYGPFSPRE